MFSCKNDNKHSKNANSKEKKNIITPKKETYSFTTEGLVAQLNIDDSESLNGTLVKNRDNFKDSAISLNGHNESIIIENNESLNPNGPFSISLWFKPVTFEGDGFRAILNKGLDTTDSPYYQYQIGINGKDSTTPYSFHFILSLGNKIETIVSEPNTWEPNEWINIIAVYDGLYIKLYLDGYLSGNRAVSGTVNSSSQDLLIGKHALLDKFTPGVYDEILFYNRALTTEEIEDISF
jgi:hypothetical protein